MGAFSRAVLHGKKGDPRFQGSVHRARGGGISLQKFVKGDRDVTEAWSKVYSQAIRSRKQFLIEVDKIKSFYIVDAISRNLAEDALTPDVMTGEVLELSSKDSKIDVALKELQDRCNLDQVFTDLSMDLIRQGEHTLRMEVKRGDGVIDIADDVDQTSVVGMYRYGFPYAFLVSGRAFGLEVKRPYEYAHFTINRHKLRVNLGKEVGSLERPLDMSGRKDMDGRPLPTYARIGRSIFWGVLSKIKELMLLEMLVPTKKINDVMKGNLVGVNMPQGMEIEDSFEACREYESVLNKRLGLDRNTDDFAVADIISAAGMIRCLPVFGDKGRLENISEVRQDKSLEDLGDRISDGRKVICDSIGYPHELLYGSDSDKRGDIIKRYARYLRVLKSIQASGAWGMKQIGMAHVINLGFTDATPSDIDVSFRNELVNVDELDKLEMVDAVVGILENVNRLVGELEENELTQGMVDMPVFKEWVHEQTKLLGRSKNFIKISDDGEDEVPTEAEEAISESYQAKAKLMKWSLKGLHNG